MIEFAAPICFALVGYLAGRIGSEQRAFTRYVIAFQRMAARGRA